MSTMAGSTDDGFEVVERHDEEQAMGGNQGMDKEGKDMYNEEEYLAEVGEMNCYCVPSRVYGVKDFLFRTLAWLLLNKEQRRLEFEKH